MNTTNDIEDDIEEWEARKYHERTLDYFQSLQSCASSYASTCAINPKTMLTILNEKGAKQRLRWQDYGYETQKGFLLNYVKGFNTVIESNLVKIQYQYELTQNGNYHLHAALDFNPCCDKEEIHTYLDNAKISFCDLISPKMPEGIRNRTILTKQVYARSQWIEYINKDQEKPEQVRSPEVIPKKKLF